MRKPAFLVVTMLLVLAAAASAQEANTKTFRNFKCSYSLPGPGWEWVEDVAETKGQLCFARNEEGLVFMMLVSEVPQSVVFDSKAIAEFEKGMFSAGAGKILSKRPTTFKGVPAYEVKVSLAPPDDGNVLLTRAFLANGLLYAVQIVGDEPSIEAADFDAISGGFAFIGKPRLHKASADVSKITHGIGLLVLVVILLVWGGKKVLGR